MESAIQDIVAQCLRNQPRAQQALYQQFAPAMLGLCYRYARDRQEAHDMLQEGFVRVFRKLHQWQGKGELGAWIRSIMVRSALNWLRDHHKWTTTDVDQLAQEQLPATLPDAMPNLQARELAGLLQQLPPGYRAVFNLFAIEGFSHSEIAGMLQISEGTSRSQYLRARRMLATWLTADEPQKPSDYARTI